MAEFKVGELVKLKSDGPVMTVNAAHRAGFGDGGPVEHYTCSWFAGNKLQTGRFAPDAIEPAEDEE